MRGTESEGPPHIATLRFATRPRNCFNDAFREGGNANRWCARVLKGTFLVLLFGLLNAVVSHFGIYDRYSTLDTDKVARYAQNAAPSAGEVPAAVVLIGDDDYQTIFGGTEPLAPAPILNVLETLCHMNVAAIGVDIFSDQWTKKTAQAHLSQRQLDKAVKRLKDCRLVWIRAASLISPETPPTLPYYLLGGVLGRDAPAAGVCTALPVFAPDFDYVIRQEQAFLPAAIPGSPPAPYVTMAEALQKPLSPGKCGFSQDISMKESALTLGYRQNMNIKRLPFSMFYSKEAGSKRNSFYEERRALVESLGIDGNTVVIVGAAFPDARDSYMTPLGQMYGAEILANAAVADTIHNLDFWPGLLLDTALSEILMFLVLWIPTFTLQSVVAVAASGLLAVIIGFATYQHLGISYSPLLSVLGAGVAVVGEPLVDKVIEDLRSAWKRCKALLNNAGKS